MTYLYIIGEADQRDTPGVKVGIAGDVKARLSSLQTGSPRRLRVFNKYKLSSRDEARLVEKTVHRRLAGHRLVGEWFNIDPSSTIATCDDVVQKLPELVKAKRDVTPERGVSSIYHISPVTPGVTATPDKTKTGRWGNRRHVTEYITLGMVEKYWLTVLHRGELPNNEGEFFLWPENTRCAATIDALTWDIIKWQRQHPIRGKKPANIVDLLSYLTLLGLAALKGNNLSIGGIYGCRKAFEDRHDIIVEWGSPISDPTDMYDDFDDLMNMISTNITAKRRGRQ